MRPYAQPAGAEKDQQFPHHLVWGLVALCALPSILSLAGVDFGWPDHAPDPAALSRMSPLARVDWLRYCLQGSFLHNLLEWTAVCLAVLTALITFIHFDLTRNMLTPVIGAALFWSGCVDAFHTLASDHFIHRVADAERFIPITWTASRLFSCVVLLVGAGILLVHKRDRNRWDRSLLMGTVGAFGIGSYALVQYCANSARLPQCLFPGRLLARPYDLIPVILYVVAGYPLFRLLNRRAGSRFSHALLISIVPQAASELHMALGSSTLYDAHFNIAHFLKIVAYAVPLAGLLLDYMSTYRLQAGLMAELERSSRVLEEERRVLELVAKGASLKNVLDALTGAVERMSPGILCTILLLDEEGRRLLAGSGPSLPAEYMRMLNGLEIGPNVGACGTAAFRNETVVVEDIATDHRFAAARDFVMSHGLQACWSVPIRDSKRNVLGTFAMYHRRPAKPGPQDLRLVEAGARLAGNAIERLRAEEHLREDAGRMALAEEVAGFGIWEVDLLRGRLTISAGLAALLGRSGGCLRMGVHELDGAVYPDDLPAVRAIAEKALANREMVQAEFRIVRLNGSLRWMRIQARMEPDGAQPVKITGAAIDITEEKEALLRLEQARGTAERAVRVKDEFVANMSHEIRTPMNGIIGSISLLVDSGVTEEQQEHVDTIRSCGEALLILVNDILDLAKVEAGKLTLEETPFKLEQVVKEALAFVAPAATARGLELRQHLAEDLTQLVVVGDPQRLRQILLNLLSNAVKFTERGHVTVEASLARRSGDLAEVRFDVRDTGIGIPAEVQEAIFQPFTQADSSTTRRYGGTGLGLSICSKLIALMGGKLELKSELGHGSSFSFTARLPITTAAEPPARATECRLPRSLRRLRILVAEDNAVNQKVALRLLEGMGHQVDTAWDGEQTVAAVERTEYDLVLMDCQMPRLDGYAATRAIRGLERGHRLPIVAMTANAMADDRQRCLEAAMDDFLTKPVSKRRLYDLLEGLRAPAEDELVGGGYRDA